MAFDPFKAYQAGLDAEDRIEKRRGEKAKAFREYVDAKVQNGEQVDPLELDRMRMSMAGGDPYLASYIPAGDALSEMANRANEQSKLSRLKLGAEGARQRGVERDYVQRIIDENWDKDETQMAEIFGAAFGQDGVRIYDQYKPELSGMLSEATNKKYYTLSQNPASKLVKDEADLYRYFPAEMRNPKTAALLRTMAKDNQRQRNIDDVDTVTNIMKNTPDFVLKNPEMQKWWGDIAGQAVPGGPAGYQTVLSEMSTQMASEQQSKIIDLASKDPYFANAVKTGDEELIFSSVRSLMVQAGMPAPQTPNDQSYLAVKKNLDLVSKTLSISSYDRREAELKAAYSEEAEAQHKDRGKRTEAVMAAMFPVNKYGNGKSGKNAGLDDRITMAVNMIGTDPSFFGSEENIQSALRFIKDAYDSDPKGFDPAATAGKFMAEGDIESRSQSIDRRVKNGIRSEYVIKPGTNFRTEYESTKQSLQEAMSRVFSNLNSVPETQEEYENMLQSKAVIVQGLRAEVGKIREVVNTLNNDPAQRSQVVDYDYGQSLQMLRTLESQLSSIERINPIPPEPVVPTPQAAPGGTVPAPPPYTQQDTDTRGQRIMGSIRNWNNEAYNAAQKRYDDRQRLLQQRRDDRYSSPLEWWNEVPGAAQQPVYGTVEHNSESTIPLNSRLQMVPTNAPTRIHTYLDRLAEIESGGDPFARAKTSSAKGLLQFTDPTWKAMVSKYGQQHGITEQDIYNPAAQRIMGAYLTMENAEQLIRQTGKEPTERDLYLAHFLGAGRASTVINAQGSQLLAANMFPDAARANRDIFYKDGVPVTIEELYKILGNKVTNS